MPTTTKQDIDHTMEPPRPQQNQNDIEIKSEDNQQQETNVKTEIAAEEETLDQQPPKPVIEKKND